MKKIETKCGNCKKTLSTPFQRRGMILLGAITCPHCNIDNVYMGDDVDPCATCLCSASPFKG